MARRKDEGNHDPTEEMDHFYLSCAYATVTRAFVTFFPCLHSLAVVTSLNTEPWRSNGNELANFMARTPSHIASTSPRCRGGCAARSLSVPAKGQSSFVDGRAEQLFTEGSDKVQGLLDGIANKLIGWLTGQADVQVIFIDIGSIRLPMFIGESQIEEQASSPLPYIQIHRFTNSRKHRRSPFRQSPPTRK